jgi:hypothetical protein
MNIFRRFWLYLGIEFILIVYTFWDFFIQPTKWLLGNTGDGLKNYFHFLGYILPSNSSFLFHTKTNYPFGESLFYLDNIPVLAFAIKWISTYIIDLSAYCILIHNWFIILNILMCFSFCFLLFKKMSINIPLAGLAAIILSFTNPLLFRINGHFALSFSSAIVVFLYLLYYLQEFIDSKNLGKIWQFSSLITLWIYFASLIHIYFLAILATAFGLYLLVALNKKIISIKYIFLLALPLISALLTLETIQLVDPYYSFRPSGGGGYDWEFHNFRLDALYSAKFTPIKTIPFFIESGYTPHFESFGYLGGFILYGALAIAGLRLLKFMKLNFSNKFIQYLLVVGVISLFISLGNKIQMFGHNGLSTDNWISPFFWLSKFSASITHFRVLARFSWMFYFMAFILVIYFLNQIQLNNFKNKLALTYVIMIGLSDVYDWSIHLKENSSHHNPMILTENDKVKIDKIDYTKYKAAYIFPYFQVGTNDLDYTLDDYEPVSSFAYAHTLYTGLPMANHKASRTPDSFAIIQINKLKSAFSLDTLSNRKHLYLTFLYHDSMPRLNAFKADEFFNNKWRDLIHKTNGKHIVSLDKFEVFEISL